MSQVTTSSRIAGITVAVISSTADRVTRGEADAYTAVREAAQALVGNNTIEQNMRIINARGSVFQAIRLYNESNNDLNMLDELVFSSQLALGYVVEHLASRVNPEVAYRQAVAREAPARAAPARAAPARAAVAREAVAREAPARVARVAREAPAREAPARVTRARAAPAAAQRFSVTAPPTDDTCPICMCDHTEAPGEWSITRCNHTFHTGCITRWGRSTCPMCRGDL
jgi:hypothetical protein